jgi:hypothetical protein
MIGNRANTLSKRFHPVVRVVEQLRALDGIDQRQPCRAVQSAPDNRATNPNRLI